MDRASLLEELEALAYSPRVTRMVELGRQARTDRSVGATIEELSRGGFYERQMALWSCAGSGDAAHVLRATEEPSQLLSNLALHLLPAACGDADAAALLASLPRSKQRRLAARLWRLGRHNPVHSLINDLARRDDPEVVALLAYTTESQARAIVERYADRITGPEWGHLAARHPRLAADAMRGLLEADAQRNPRLGWQATGALDVLADREPDAALALVPPLLRHVSLEALRHTLGTLARRRPNEVADLLLASDESANVALDGVAHRLSPDRLLTLLSRRPDALPRPDEWLGRLPRRRRAEVWAAANHAWRHGADQVVAADILASLPPDLRHEEARRHLVAPELSTGPAAQRLPYAALLPWDEARKVLDEPLRSPDAADRGAAVAALVGVARYEPQRLPELLRLLLDRRNEQDPVRLSALQALADLPPGRWRTEHLEDLGRLLQDTLDAADTSPAAAAHAERLLVALLPFHADWAVAWMARIVAERGTIGSHALGERLTDDQARRLAPALAKVLEEWEARERLAHILHVARSLGRRLRRLDPVADVLENAVYELHAEYELDAALSVLFEYRRDRVRALVPAMLARDPSWITRPRVHQYLHHSQQDLLTPFLGRRTFAGRFSTGRTRYVLPLRGGFWRWTAAQQAAFAKTLGQVIGDKARDTPGVLQAIRQLAELPDPPPERLVKIAEGKGVKKAVRDTALRALGRLDGGRGVDALLRALGAGDDRARVAVYALRRTALLMPPGEALRVLRSVRSKSVTVSKEIVRLLGDLRGDEVFDELTDWGRRDLHRDVRVALLRALWGHLDRDEAWAVLAEAARSPDVAIASVAMRVPSQRLTSGGQRRLAGLLAHLLRHPDRKLRLQTLQHCAAHPVGDPDRAILPALLEAMGSPVNVESAAAARAVFTTYGGEATGAIAGAVYGLLPNRRALKTAVEALRDAAALSPSRVLPTVRAVLDVLAPDRLTAALRARIAMAALPASELAPFLRSLASGDHLDAGVLAAIVSAVPRRRASAPSDWEDLEAALAGEPDERLRRVALAALVMAARIVGGWTDARKTRLANYQGDPSPLVAAPAQFTFVSGDVDMMDLEIWDDWTELM